MTSLLFYYFVEDFAALIHLNVRLFNLSGLSVMFPIDNQWAWIEEFDAFYKLTHSFTNRLNADQQNKMKSLKQNKS